MSVNSSQQKISLLCDNTTMIQLKNLPEQVDYKICLYPFYNKNINKLQYIIIETRRINSKIQTNQNIFDVQRFKQFHQVFTSKPSQCQLISYVFKNSSIRQLLSNQLPLIQLKKIDNIVQLNNILKSHIILTLTFPQQFFNLQSQLNYHLQAFQFNPKGSSTFQSNYIHNGRVNKCIFAINNDKIKKQLKQNVTYSKNQLNLILDKINKVLTLNKSQKISIVQQLSLLGQNYVHSDKYVNNNNFIIPLLKFQIVLICSLTPTDKHKNNIKNQIIRKNNHKNIVSLCLDFNHNKENILQINQQLIRQRIQKLFIRQNNKQQNQHRLANNNTQILLTKIPTKIVNPHYFLKSQVTKESFTQYFIKGLYQYYHYGDHNFNDQGWGCAYRSLQTVLSWFRLQNILNLIQIPTINQIQNIIDLIDYNSTSKLSSTNNWIGATQVSWVIKKLTDKDCMILHIKDGKDVIEYAEQIRNHLENVGTPIMYGGDQYAYTIVGINYSWKLGEIMFLILDPHYNGSDKIQKIIQKKGIAWKKPEDMFKKGVFYNFCLPLL